MRIDTKAPGTHREARWDLLVPTVDPSSQQVHMKLCLSPDPSDTFRVVSISRYHGQRRARGSLESEERHPRSTYTANITCIHACLSSRMY